MEDEYTRRRGSGIEWQMVSKGFAGNPSVTTGFTIDNLDTKRYEEAADQYERIFILIRKALEENNSCCMDVEEERLLCAQAAVNLIRKNRLL